MHRFSAGLAAVGALGALPRPALGGAVDIAWTPWRIRVEAEGRFVGAQSPHVSGKVAGASISPKGIGARGCFAAVRTSAFDVSPCAGLDVDILSADGFNADHTLSRTGTFTALAGGALGRAFLAEWLAIRLRLEAAAALNRPRFLVEGQGAVFRVPTAAGAAFFGGEVLFL
jgi:hypothetical protein